MGWSNDRIAGCIRDPRTGKTISVPTLKRHFRPELKVRAFARDQLFAKMLMTAGEAAFTDRNVGAMRLLQQLVEKNDMALAERRVAASDAPEPSQERLGKKAQNALAAEEAEDALRAAIEAEARAARH